jgi:D-galactarolactone cycloisomerase
VAIAASLQLLATLPHNPPALAPIEPILEFDQSEHPLRMAILKEPIHMMGGAVAIPTGPGLGIEIDRTQLDRFRR